MERDLTVADVLSALAQMPPDRPVIVVYDGGTTYGPVRNVEFDQVNGDAVLTIL